MPVILLRLKTKDSANIERPKQCPSCGNQILQSWGQVVKAINDGQDVLKINRYRCTECKRVFRHYPQGVDRSSYAKCLRRLAALISIMGLSYREAANTFKQLGVEISYSTIWREGHELEAKLEGHLPNLQIDGYSIDKEYIHRVSSKFGVVVAIDLGGNDYEVVGTLNEFNPRIVIADLQHLVEDTNIEVLQLNTSALDPYQIDTPMV